MLAATRIMVSGPQHLVVAVCEFIAVTKMLTYRSLD